LLPSLEVMALDQTFYYLEKKVFSPEALINSQKFTHPKAILAKIRKQSSFF